MTSENSSLLTYMVEPDSVGLRIDQFLAKKAEIQSRTKAIFLIENDLVKMNGVPPKSSARLKSGDVVEVTLPPARPTELQPLDLKLDVVFEDEDLLVVNKPSGLVVHPAQGHEQDTLVNALLHHTTQLSMRFGEQRPGIVHRIDKETSGLLVVAKNDLSHEGLSSQFKNKTSHRVYEAVILGQPKKTSGTLKSFLARHLVARKKFASTENDEDGKLAITHYKLLATGKQMSLLELQLETGRTHQIRVHLSEQGTPIAGDALYGADKKTRSLAPSAQQELKSLGRFLLHARELGFVHPRSKEAMSFRVDWPAREKAFINSCFFQKDKG